MQQGKLTKQIAACQAEIARLEGERERYNAAIARSEYDPTALDDLRRRRAHECAEAFIEQRKANVVELDKEIAAAEKVRAPSMEQASAAIGAVNLINERCGELKTELVKARTALKAVIEEDIGQRHAKARETFNAAVDALRVPLAELRALDSVTATMHGTGSRFSASQQMLDALAEEGLRIFTPRGLGGPDWLRNLGSTEVYESLVTEFRAAGLDI
jgi:hypothetical protein